MTLDSSDPMERVFPWWLGMLRDARYQFESLPTPIREKVADALRRRQIELGAGRGR